MEGRGRGIAERKLKHLLGVTRTLLIHMHVSKYFWADVVICACYLINRMSSFVPHNKIPFSCMYPDKYIFSVVPRVFGSTCYVRNLQSSLNK